MKHTQTNAQSTLGMHNVSLSTHFLFDCGPLLPLFIYFSKRYEFISYGRVLIAAPPLLWPAALVTLMLLPQSHTPLLVMAINFN